jgi:hypothetical protein
VVLCHRIQRDVDDSIEWSETAAELVSDDPVKSVFGLFQFARFHRSLLSPRVVSFRERVWLALRPEAICHLTDLAYENHSIGGTGRGSIRSME